jgi:hypothetical protein
LRCDSATELAAVEGGPADVAIFQFTFFSLQVCSLITNIYYYPCGTGETMTVWLSACVSPTHLSVYLLVRYIQNWQKGCSEIVVAYGWQT